MTNYTNIAGDMTPRELLAGLWILLGEDGWPSKFSSHSYVFEGAEQTILVDPGCSTHEAVLRHFFEGRRAPDMIIVTHEHWDHVCAADYFPHAVKAASPAAVSALNEQDPARVGHVRRGESYMSTFDRTLHDKEVFNLGGVSLEVILTPGHSAGSLCLYERERGVLVTGDTLFCPPYFSVIAEGGSRGEHVKSLEKLAELECRMILPGHGKLALDVSTCQDTMQASLGRGRGEL